MWLAKAIAPSARAFLLKSCSSLRRCSVRPPDRSRWSVCRVCSPYRPPALRTVHTSNFTGQFQHTTRPRERFSRRVPSDHIVWPFTSRIGRSECLYEEIYLTFGSGAQETGCTSLHGRRGAAPAQTTRRPWHDPLWTLYPVCIRFRFRLREGPRL